MRDDFNNLLVRAWVFFYAELNMATKLCLIKYNLFIKHKHKESKIQLNYLFFIL